MFLTNYTATEGHYPEEWEDTTILTCQVGPVVDLLLQMGLDDHPAWDDHLLYTSQHPEHTCQHWGDATTDPDECEGCDEVVAQIEEDRALIRGEQGWGDR